MRLFNKIEWVFIPNLNNSKTCVSVNDFDLDQMSSVGGKFRNRKLEHKTLL